MSLNKYICIIFKMKVGYFCCEQLPANFNELYATDKLEFLIDNPTVDRDEDNKVYYSFEYDANVLSERELLDTLNFHGFVNVVIDRDRDSF